MRPSVARELSRLTTDFYARTADSFSATRNAPWPGWSRVIGGTGLLSTRSDGGSHTPCDLGANPIRVLDLACGNLRFERFLADELQARLATSDHPSGAAQIAVRAIDSCDELALAEAESVGAASMGVQVGYAHLDIAEALFAEGDLRDAFGDHGFDLAVCFGFMHHLALPEHRSRVLEALVGATRPGGHVAVAFWQLSKSEKLLAKARATTAELLPILGTGPLDEDDYLLGWQGNTDVVRYCHDYSEQEIDQLVASVTPAATEVARFSADGATGELNRYVILEVASGHGQARRP